MSRLNSGILSLKLEWHDLSDLLGVVIQKNQKSLSRHQLKTNGFDEIVLVKIDFRLLEHAISNLLINAALYAPPQTEIRISIKKENQEWILSIEDEGPGIPEASIDKIFEKFYRVPGTPTGGTGLGLSIVKSIVELHKGSVDFSNRQPHGSRFRIHLPVQLGPSLPEESSI